MAKKKERAYEQNHSTKGAEGNKLFNKYKSHLKDNGIDIFEIEKHKELWEGKGALAHGLNVHDFNWISIRIKTKHGFSYPDYAELRQTLATWWEDRDKATRASFEELFTEQYAGGENEGKDFSWTTVRNKLKNLCKEIEETFGKVVPNPLLMNKNGPSASDAVRAGGDVW